MRNKLQNIILLALLLVVVISYLDVFNDYSNIYSSSSLSNYVMILTIICFLISFRLSCLKNRYIKTSVIYLLLISFEALIVYAIFDNKLIFNDIKNILIPFVILCIGYNINFSKKYLNILLYVYGISLLLVCLSLIMNNIGGFMITDDYKIVSKNALGAMMSSYIAIILPLYLVSDLKKINKLIYFSICVLFFLILLTIRARASTMTVFFTFGIFIFEVVFHGRKEHANVAKKVVIIGLIILCTLPIITMVFEPFGDYIRSSLFQNVEYDVTTGRIIRNEVAIEFLSENLFLGRLGSPATFEWVHNYMLRVLAEYGLAFGLIIVIFYLYLVFTIMNYFLKNNPLTYSSIGLWGLLPPIMLSFIEPLFPYGPGTSVLFAYLLLGFSIKKLSDE